VYVHSALAIVSVAGLSVGFFPKPLIACAFGCPSEEIPEICREFEFCESEMWLNYNGKFDCGQSGWRG
jgi:hypothetical protein